MNKIKSTYDEMNAEVSKILGKEDKNHFQFSMFETVEEETDDNLDVWTIMRPDFNDAVLEGEVRFGESWYTNQWYGKPYISDVYKNPTWKDLIKEANRCACGDHIFLEGFGCEKETGIKYYEFHFGS